METLMSFKENQVLVLEIGDRRLVIRITEANLSTSHVLMTILGCMPPLREGPASLPGPKPFRKQDIMKLIREPTPTEKTLYGALPLYEFLNG